MPHCVNVESVLIFWATLLEILCSPFPEQGVRIPIKDPEELAIERVSGQRGNLCSVWKYQIAGSCLLSSTVCVNRRVSREMRFLFFCNRFKIQHLDRFHILPTRQTYIIYSRVSERRPVKQPVAQPGPRHKGVPMGAFVASLCSCFSHCASHKRLS